MDGNKELPAGGTHVVHVIFKPQQPYRYGILRCLLVVRGRNITKAHPISAVVGNKEELELLKPESEYVPKESVVDNVQRIIIPAFPPARATKTHLHTPVEMDWVEKLDNYVIPEDLQVIHTPQTCYS